MTEYRGAEHFLRVHHDEGNRAIEVFHPESCGQTVIYDELGAEYRCDIASHIRHWGYDLHLKDVPDGTYLAQYWATPPGWAGPVAIDADDGIELNQMALLEEVTELQGQLRLTQSEADENWRTAVANWNMWGAE